MKVKTRRVSGLTGSQRDYGLVTGSVWNYEDKPTSNNVGTTLSPVDRDDATIEAERGETVIGDLDNDGMVEHAKIGGKRHSHGGTPLNVPDGSFVFSDYRGLLIKNTDVLKNIFGMNTNKAVTPAKVAQRYEINKFKDMLNDPFVDPIDRKTAQLMIDNNMRKLGQLALIQEGMKGFPDGIPAIAMPLMGSDFAQQGGQQKMRRGGIVSYKKGGHAKYQGKDRSQVDSSGYNDMRQIPLNMSAPNQNQMTWDPSWNDLPDWLGDIDQDGMITPEDMIAYQQYKEEIARNEALNQARADAMGNFGGVRDQTNLASPQRYSEPLFGTDDEGQMQRGIYNYNEQLLNGENPNGTLSQTPDWKTSGTLPYYKHEALGMFQSPGNALMYALDPRTKNESFSSYQSEGGNPVGSVIDMAADYALPGKFFYGDVPAMIAQHDMEKTPNPNASEAGWTGALGTLGVGAGVALLGAGYKYGLKNTGILPKNVIPYLKYLRNPEKYLAKKPGKNVWNIAGKPFMEKQLAKRMKMFPDLYKVTDESIGGINKYGKPFFKSYGPGRWGRWAERHGMQNADEIVDSPLFENVVGKPWVNYAKANTTVGKVLNFANRYKKAALIGSGILGTGAIGYYGQEYNNRNKFSDKEIEKGQNTLKSNDWTTIEDAKQDSIAAWAKTQGITNFKSQPDSVKSKWTAEYLKQLNNARTILPVSDSISTAADDIGGKVEAITADSTKATSDSTKVDKKTGEKRKVQVILPKKKDEVKLSQMDIIGKKLYTADWDTMSTENKKKALSAYGYNFRDGGTLKRFDVGGTDKFYYVKPEQRDAIYNKGLDLEYNPASTLQNSSEYAGPQKGNFKLSPSGMWVPKTASDEEIGNIDKETLNWIKNHEAYQNQWTNYNAGGYDQLEKDLAVFAKDKKENESFPDAETRFETQYGRNPYKWLGKTFDKEYFNPQTGYNYFEYDDKGELKSNFEIPGLQFRGLPKVRPRPKTDDKVTTDNKKVVADSQDIYPPQFQKTQNRRLPNPRLADLMGEWGAAMQETRRYPSMYAPVNNAPVETIYDRFNAQPLMGAYTTALQNAGTGPASARAIDNVTGKTLEGVAQGQEQVQTQVNNPRFMNMVAQNQQATMRTDAYNAGEKIRFQDDVATKWQDYLANYNKKLANVTEKTATTAENRYKLGLMQAMYPYANLNFDEFPTANATLNSITDEPVTASSTESDSFSTMQQKAYDYYLKQGMSKQEASKAAIEHIKAQMAYNKMYSGTAMSPFIS